jgi:photosystem II stability/assembly factor-like uncharacterized protein
MSAFLFYPCSSSADPLDYWTSVSSNTSATLLGVTYSSDSGTFVVVGASGTILTLPYGGTWSPHNFDTGGNWLNAIAYGNSKFVAVGDFGTALTSSNGQDWTALDLSTNRHLDGITNGNSIFVAVGVHTVDETIFTSSNGTAWTRIPLQGSSDLRGATYGTYGNGVFVIVGSVGGEISSAIFTSSDGATWTRKTSGTGNYLEGVATDGNGTFVAVGANGTILRSADNGATWAQKTSGTSNHLLGVAYGDNHFVAVGVLGTILTSSDNGLTWSSKASGTSARLYGITHGNNIFVVVGESGTILTASAAIVINSGAAYTISPSVNLTLSCSTPTGCVHMQFSNDNTTWIGPYAYATTYTPWPLSSVDGAKTVYVQFQDNASNWTNAYFDTILLDTAAPTTTAFPIGGIYFDPYVYVSLTCNDGSGEVSGCDKIYYTTDESPPTTSSPIYSIPVRLTAATPIINFFAVDKAGNQEAPAKSETYTFDPPLTITTTSLASGTLGVSYSDTLTATGGFPPYTWSIISGSFPGGLSLNSATGVISGTPTISGTFNFTAQVTDGFHPNNTYTKALSITINGPQYTLSISKGGTGTGTVTSSPAGINCGSTCSALYNSGTSVTLTATADSGSIFSGWSGGVCSGTGTCTLTMTAATSVTANFDPTPPGTYSYKKCLNGDTTTATGINVVSTQTDFPIAVHICPNCTSPNFNSTEKAHFFGLWNVNGKRVQFLASDQTTILPYEVEYYNSSSGYEEAVYWVKVPIVTGNNVNSNMVCVAYGNDPNSSDQDNKTGVWDSNFKMVQHLGDNSWGASPEAKDSTNNANNGTNVGTTDRTGYVRRGRDFNGTTNYIDIPNTFSSLSEGTLAGFINIDANGGYDDFIVSDTGGTNNFLMFSHDSNNSMRFQIASTSTLLYANTPVNSITAGNNYYVSATVSTSGNAIYINGGAQTVTYAAGSSSTQAFFNSISASQDTRIGKFIYGGTGYTRFNGYMDEVRISSTARSADWIKLEYYSMKKTNWNGDSWITWHSEI